MAVLSICVRKLAIQLMPRQWNVQIVVSDDEDQYDTDDITAMLEYSGEVDIEVLNISEVKLPSTNPNG